MLFAQTVTYTTTDASAAAGASIVFTLIYVAIVAAQLIFSILCIIDTTKHSEEAFQAAGTPKQTALILTIVGLLCCLLVNLYYWFGIRPKVIQAEQGGLGGPPMGYPPQ